MKKYKASPEQQLFSGQGNKMWEQSMLLSSKILKNFACYTDFEPNFSNGRYLLKIAFAAASVMANPSLICFVNPSTTFFLLFYNHSLWVDSSKVFLSSLQQTLI